MVYFWKLNNVFFRYNILYDKDIFIKLKGFRRCKDRLLKLFGFWG